jgi:hypothetical protein
MEGNNMEVYH